MFGFGFRWRERVPVGPQISRQADVLINELRGANCPTSPNDGWIFEERLFSASPPTCIPDTHARAQKEHIHARTHTRTHPHISDWVRLLVCGRACPRSHANRTRSESRVCVILARRVFAPRFQVGRCTSTFSSRCRFYADMCEYSPRCVTRRSTVPFHHPYALFLSILVPSCFTGLTSTFFRPLSLLAP
jgi:hypothetical protein